MVLTLNTGLSITKRISLLILLLTGLNLLSQNKYWVFLEGKSDQNPLALSKTAQVLRSQFSIAIDYRDLSIDAYKKELIAQQGYKIIAESRWLNALVVEIDNFPEKLKALDFVNQIVKVKSLSIPIEEPFMLGSRSLNDSAYYGIAWNQIKMLNGHKLHALGFEGQNINIGVFDNGFINMDSIAAFDSLFTQGRIKTTYDFVNSEENVFNSGRHGTMVMSTMAALWPDSIVGTAPKANYYLFHTENDLSETRQEEYNWVVAAERADSLGVQVLNTSLGYSIMDDESQNYSYQDMDGNTTIITQAADIAASKGMLVINSAGNSGSSNWHYITAPADGDSVLAIGAVDKDGLLASFSSRGPSYDGRVKPNVVAQGLASAIVTVDGNLAFNSGTSFSGPIVCGLAACLWQAHRDKNNMQIFKAIEQSATQYLLPDDDYGFGIPDFWQAHLILSDSIPADSIISHVQEHPRVWYQNPAGGQISFVLGNPVIQDARIECFNLSGQLIYSKQKLLYTGVNKIVIDSEFYTNNQMLIIRITTSNYTTSFKLIP